MKKLFTLIALLTCFMGAKAQNWEQVYSIDYSTYNGFPFYVMGYVPEWFDGVMTDFGADFRYATQADLDGEGDAKWKDGESSVGTVTTQAGVEYQKVTGAGPYWHQYFIADGIPTVMDGRYKVVALVKASEAVTVNVNMGWGWGSGEQASTSVAIGTDWTEVEWEYSGIAGSSCNLVAQPGASTATIEWKWLKVSEFKKASRPTVWQQWLTDDGNSIITGVEHTNKYVGDAEFGAWPAWSLELTDGVNINWRTDRAPEICAWALTMGKNNDSGTFNGNALDGRARPFPADIEAEAGNESNHVFAVHVTQIEKIDEDASIAWSNQFWIQSPKEWKANSQVKIKFRYKAEHACKVGTQWHKKNPSDYNDWNACGDISFTEEWQDFEATKSVPAGTASLAFNLCSDADNGRTPNVFYFDNLSWETMVLDEGLFVAGANTKTGAEYELDTAIEFVYDETEEAYKAVVGEKGNQSSWVNEVMISTVRGDDASFKGATLKPKASVTDDPDQWIDYEAGSLAKIKLPAAGVWQIMVDTEAAQMNFVKLEGEAAAEPVDIVTNPYVCTVNALERDWRGTDNDGNPIEAEVGEGQPWDNQFWIVANRVLDAGEETVVEFDYVATKDAKASTQTHAAPGTYIHWAAIGDVNFTTEEQHFSYDFTIPAEAAGKDAQSIAFNLAEIKDANDYTIKNFKWYLKSDVEGKTTENLIKATGGTNFAYKVVGGQITYFETSGISNVTTKNSKPAGAIYNIAGQKVDKSYKGLVIQNGKKFVNK